MQWRCFAAGFIFAAAPLCAFAASTTVIPPLGSAIEKAGPPETAIYATAGGKTWRLAPTEGGAGGQYPERALRLGLEGDVPLRCLAPARCAAAGAVRWADLTPPAVNLADRLATPDRAYPFDVVISFRIASFDRVITDWAPQTCPDPNDRSAANEGLKRDLEITGECITPMGDPPDAK